MAEEDGDRAPQLGAIAQHIAQRGDSILERWRAVVDGDPRLTTSNALSRTQFRDHIPQVIDALVGSLRTGLAAAPEAAADQGPAGAEHGLHRWQQGYSLHEVMLEWGHLQSCIADEIQAHIQTQPSVDRTVVSTAFRALARLTTEGMSESTAQFMKLQRAEAAGQAIDLGAALDAARGIERQQAELLRQAAHDLRGQLGVVTNATHALSLDDLPSDKRAQLFAMVQRAVASQTALLGDLMELSRLQAGHERRRAEPVDVADLLSGLVRSAQLIAEQRSLTLQAEGPGSLIVETDRVKLTRIVQNLLLNALSYTASGGVRVRWGDSRRNDPDRWMVTVQDTGPGLQFGAAEPLADALNKATAEALDVEPGPPTPAGEAAAAQSGRRSGAVASHRHGEGIGLSIVKRLCELLDASVEWESQPGEGTTVRVILPRSLQGAQSAEPSDRVGTAPPRGVKERP